MAVRKDRRDAWSLIRGRHRTTSAQRRRGFEQRPASGGRLRDGVGRALGGPAARDGGRAPDGLAARRSM